MIAPDTLLQNRYRVIRQLGQGGMGTVYEATDERLDTTVALKETHFTDERLRKQFEREARLLARLRHPAMTRVIDHFDEGAGQFLVMDFIPGDDLWTMIQQRDKPFPTDDVLSWGEQLLDVLDYLHTQEPPIVHRDIKPQNLKLTGRGQIILLDFGLAKGFAGQVSRVTTSGSIFGYTPNYAPLEQIQGTGTDPRSDLYSLGATLYHLITNVVLPDALTRAAAMISERPDPLRPAHEINSQLAPPVSDVLCQALAQNRDKRPASAAAMLASLRNAARPVAPFEKSEAKTIVMPSKATAPAPAQNDGARERAPVPPTIASPFVLQDQKESTPAVAVSIEEMLQQPHAPEVKRSEHSRPQTRPKKRRKWIVLGILVFAIVAFIISQTAHISQRMAGSAYISSVKLSEEPDGMREVNSFYSTFTVYVAADITDSNETLNVTARVIADDVEGSSNIQIYELTENLNGSGIVSYTFPPTPRGIWHKGSYEVEVSIFNKDGKRLDNKSANFTVR